MGTEDHAYPREQQSTSDSEVDNGHIDSVTTWLIFINIAVYVLDTAIQVPQAGKGWPSVAGSFTVGQAVFDLQLWRFITFQFLHDGQYHLLFNMLGLYFFGPIVEGYLGSRRFLAFYLLCGIAGAAGYVLLWWLSTVSTFQLVQLYAPLVGASAGIFGTLIGAATIHPDARIFVYGAFPARLKGIAWTLIVIAIYNIFVTRQNPGGEAAHLGGAVLGWLLIRQPRVLNLFGSPPPRRHLESS